MIKHIWGCCKLSSIKENPVVENKYHIEYNASYIKDYKTKHISSNSSTKLLSTITLQKLITNIEVCLLHGWKCRKYSWNFIEILRFSNRWYERGDKKSVRRKIDRNFSCSQLIIKFLRKSHETQNIADIFVIYRQYFRKIGKKKTDFLGCWPVEQKWKILAATNVGLSLLITHH